MGTPVLDETMGGGLPAGHSLLVAAPSGSGKSMLSTAFVTEGARVIDSLSGFERAPAPAFRKDSRESLHRMVAVPTAMGTTVLMVSELEGRYDDLRFSPYGAAFLTDAIIGQRYVELQGELKRVMPVVKVRNSPHGHALRFYDIGAEGIVIGAPRLDIEALLTGSAYASTPRVAGPRGDVG